MAIYNTYIYTSGIGPIGAKILVEKTTGQNLAQ